MPDILELNIKAKGLVPPILEYKLGTKFKSTKHVAGRQAQLFRIQPGVAMLLMIDHGEGNPWTWTTAVCHNIKGVTKQAFEDAFGDYWEPM